jgi:peptidoglycan/xylan/chitin deacetylase (PgdA/CDA1 family)
MMRVPGRKVLRRALRPIRRRFFPGAIVLGYHRVADDPWEPLQLQVRSRHFDAHLEVLKSLRTVISLSELMQRQAAGEPLERYAVLTFDDGYADFATTVAPLATRAGVPVTVFVATGCLGREFWWEALAGLLAPGAWGAPELEVRVADAETLRFSGLEQPAVRAEAVNAIAERLSRADRATVERVLEQVRAWAGPGCAAGAGGTPMTEAALEEVARNPLVEVGAHTVSHCFLEGLDAEAQRAEIAGSKTTLEQLCGRPMEVFSYPNGSYSFVTPRIVRDLGFSCACASMEGSFSRRGNPYMIPRLWVPDLPGPDFRRWLGQWVAAAQA